MILQYFRRNKNYGMYMIKLHAKLKREYKNESKTVNHHQSLKGGLNYISKQLGLKRKKKTIIIIIIFISQKQKEKYHK